MGSFVLRFGLSVLLCCVVACSRVRSRGPVLWGQRQSPQQPQNLNTCNSLSRKGIDIFWNKYYKAIFKTAFPEKRTRKKNYHSNSLSG
jgi:hypothetical protein